MEKPTLCIGGPLDGKWVVSDNSFIYSHYTQLTPVAADGNEDMGVKIEDKTFTYYRTPVNYSPDIEVYAPSSWNRDDCILHFIYNYCGQIADDWSDDDDGEKRPTILYGPKPEPEIVEDIPEVLDKVPEPVNVLVDDDVPF